jgi:hypothetical protein
MEVSMSGNIPPTYNSVVLTSAWLFRHGIIFTLGFQSIPLVNLQDSYDSSSVRLSMASASSAVQSIR